jgi:aminocarboxymuconate-semialdehyde decarboxylase
VVDVHCHTYPAEFLAELRQIAQQPGGAGEAARRQLARPDFADAQMTGALDERRGLMDEAGIDTEILSVPAVLHTFTADRAAQTALAQGINNAFSAACERYPGRFRFFATLPLPDAAASIDELERARHLPGFAGTITTTNFGLPFHHESLEELYGALARQQTLFFIHPQRTPNPGRFGAMGLESTLVWPSEDSLCVMELMYGGVLDRHPALTVVAPHLGGIALWLWARIDHGYDNLPPDGRSRERPTYYFRRMYYDSVIGQRPALDLARTLVGADHILLGSDFPFWSRDHMAECLEIVDGLDWPEAERALVRGGNVERLLRERGLW